MSAFEFVAWDGQEYPQEPPVKRATTRQKQVRQVVEAKSDPAYDTTVQFFNVGQPRYSTKDFGSFAREAYKLDSTSYKCINLVARTAAGIRWKFYTDETMKREVSDHPMVALWNKPNPRKARTRFIRDTFVFWQIAGNAYIYANRPGKQAPPQELWCLRPDRVKIIPGDNDIQAYHYGSNPYAGKTYEPQNVLHLDFLDPLDDWYGMSPLNPVLGQVDQQNEGRGWNLALMQNSGRPAGALVYPNQIREETLNALMRQIDSRISGKRNAGRPLVLDSGVEYIEMGKTPLEMDWANLREANVRDIASVLDVAPELVGDAAGKTFANVHEALQSLYTEKVLPMLDEYQDEMNMWLPAMYDQPIYAAYDRNDIEALQENKQVASTRATTGWNSGKLTLNEARKMEGLDELPGGNVLKLNAAIVPVEYLEQYAEQSIVAKLAGLQNAAQAAQQPAPPTAATNDTPQQQNGAQQAQQGGGNNGSASDNTQPARSDNKPDSAPIPGKMAGQERATKVYNLASNEDKAAYLRDMETDREKWTDEATKRIANYFAGEHTAVVQAVKAHPVIADLNTTLQNTVEAHSSKLTSELTKLYQDIGYDIGGKVMDALVQGTQEDEKASGVFVEQKALPSVSMVSEAIVRRLLTFAGTKVKEIDSVTLKLLRAALADGVAEGESIPQLAKRIDDLYLDEIIPNRSTTIASTEVVSASNFASHEAASQFSGQYGIQLKKQWLATEDDRTRPTHADADGQEVDLDEPFDVGGAQLMYPGDFSLGAPASEIIRCRCTQIYSRVSASGSTETIDEDDGLESASNHTLISLEKKRRINPYREFQEALA